MLSYDNCEAFQKQTFIKKKKVGFVGI